MRQRKERLTVTVDKALVLAGNRAVRAGRASSLSAWVNLALADRATRELRLQALAESIADYEARHGKITTAELAAQERDDRQSAVVVRGRRAAPRRRRGAA